MDGKSDAVPSRVGTRRNSGNRSKSSSNGKSKRAGKNDVGSSEKGNQIKPTNEFCVESTGDIFYNTKGVRNTNKNTSNYTAEALIGNQSDVGNRKAPFPPTKPGGSSSFLTENIITYFPTVDDNYMSQGHNFQPTSFSHNSFQNNVFTTNTFIYTAPTITSTYLPNTFESHDYIQDSFNPNKDSKGSNVKSKHPSKEEKANYTSKKAKKKVALESSTNAVGSLDFPFLSMPGSTNSPILPEDFHSHSTFLPPTAPYPPKNNPYQKQTNEFGVNPLLPMPGMSRNNIQHPEVSPSMHSGATSLTNFNLSAIFPEINKATASTVYPDNRNKEQHSNPTSLQVPFNVDPKYSFSS